MSSSTANVKLPIKLPMKSNNNSNNNSGNGNKNKSDSKADQKREQFSTKIINRLDNLTPSTSKESIQTFTKWILFHANRHSTSIQQTLKQIFILDIMHGERKGAVSIPVGSEKGVGVGVGIGIHSAIGSSSSANLSDKVVKWSSMLNIYWNILHEMCCSHSSIAAGGGNENKWNNYADFRSSLAEVMILPLLEDLLVSMEKISNGDCLNEIRKSSGSSSSNFNKTRSLDAIKELRDKLDNMHSKWKDVDSFQSPTLLDDIKRAIVKIVQFDIDGAVANAKANHANLESHSTSANSLPAHTTNNDKRTSGEELKKQKSGAETKQNDDDQIKSSQNQSNDDDDDATAKATATTKTKTSNSENTDSMTQSEVTAPVSPDTTENDHDSNITPTPSKDEDDDEDERDLFGGDSEDDVDAEVDEGSTDLKKGKSDTTTTSTTTIDSNKGEEKLDDTAAMDIDTEVEMNLETNKSPVKDSDDKTEDRDEAKRKRGLVDFNVEVDFESEGISQGKVEVNELRGPCKTIGTMQITRDLRNDFSHNLSSALSFVPKDVYEACEKVLDKDNDSDNKPISSDILSKIPDDVLDYDISDAISNIRLHRQIIEKQMDARRKCIELLIKSRCEFGSKVDAEMFYNLDDISSSLVNRKAQILDAMELEGLDFEGLDDGNGQNDEMEDETPCTFTWMSKEEALNNRDAKKQRIE